ncbi:MAG: plasmid mobilization protein [Bryobacteraceae bacterium]
MHKATRSKVLTGTASAHVTRDEEQRVRQRAAEAGLSKSEWCRQALLQALEAPPETRLLLSELLALRMIVLRLHLDLIDGDQPTKERLNEILERADATKHALAEQRIHAFHSQAVFPIRTGAAETSAG